MRRQDELWHWGIKGMKWGVRRYQNKDGTLTTAGKKHYGEDGADGANTGTEVTEYAPKVSKKKVSDYSDEELRAQINRMQMEKQYRDLSGQTNVREDDPNRELKLQRERLQLQRDVKSLKKEINGGQTFVKTVFNTAGQQALSTMMKGAMLYAGKQAVTNILGNPDLANAMATGSVGGQNTDKKKDS